MKALTVIVLISLLFLNQGCRSEGTEGGNPGFDNSQPMKSTSIRVSIAQLMFDICNSQSRCTKNQFTENTCETNLLKVIGLTDELGLNPPYPDFEKTLSSESTDNIFGLNRAKFLKCRNEIFKLDCTDERVQKAFYSDHFSSAPLLIEVAESCPQIFQPL